jgi:hypothetical protein
LARANGYQPTKEYQSYEELYNAILAHGALVVATDIADAAFVVPGGRFDGHIVAIRQSGRNIRRMLIRSDHFEYMFGNVRNCIDHVLSNNVPECAVELSHLKDLADKLGLSAKNIDTEKHVGRLETDIVASLQLLEILKDSFEDDDVTEAVFALGFSVGRLFSSVQNLVTLEPDATKANEYRKSYATRGKKGKSKDRKQERLKHLFGHIQRLVDQNEAFARLKPIAVAKLALQDALAENPKLWTQGAGQLESYLSTFASDPTFKSKYYEMFPETG